MTSDMLEYIEPSPPPLTLEQQEQQEALDLDQHFGSTLCKMMNREMSASEAISELAQRSFDVSRHCRSEASDELNQSAHRISMAAFATELESQAASWLLLQALYCSGDDPAGVYECAANVGHRDILRQMLAYTVNGDSELRRFAQVVMWLEALAAQQLLQRGVLQGAFRFSGNDGVWRDTWRCLGPSGRQQASRELDPDAVSRDQLKLAVGDQQNQNRLAACAWQLVRAGRFRDACDLCAEAGEAWRSVSLAGAGSWGPLPVGEAATLAAAAPPFGDLQEPSEEVAYEVEGGAAGSRLAWKWACCAAAAAAGHSEDTAGGNKYEAALYGALCGDVRSMLPACDSWEDEAWAYCRAWLELQTDAKLLQECQGTDVDMQDQAQAQRFFLGAAGDDADAYEVPLDVLEGVVDSATLTGYSKRTNKQLLREGVSVMNGDWPLQRLAVADNHVCLPTTLGQLYDLLANSRNTKVRHAANTSQHILQLHLMSEDFDGLVSHLNATCKQAAAQLQEQQAAGQAAGQASAAADGGRPDQVTGALSSLHHWDDSSMLGGGDSGQGSMSSKGLASVLRFNAHMALALRALGLLQDPDDVDLQDDTLCMLQQVLSQVIACYASHLAAQPSTLAQVPAYLCQLRLADRRPLAAQLFDTALDAGSDQQCEVLVRLITNGTQYCFEQQQLEQQKLQRLRREHERADDPEDLDDQESNALQPNLFGKLRPEEARLLLRHVVYTAFTDAGTSPQRRCDQLRWMLLSFVDATRETGMSHQQQPPLWQGCWADAVSNCLGLATQLVLRPRLGGSALIYLMQSVVPEGFAAIAQDSAAAAAAAAAAGTASPELDSAVSRAAGVDVMQVAGQLQVQRQLLALAFWQQYALVEAQYHAWKRSPPAAPVQAARAVQQASPPAEAVALVQQMLQLASQDALRLPAPQDLSRLLEAMQQSSAAAEAPPPPSVAEGDWLCQPCFDAWADQLLLATCAEGSSEQVLGLLPYNKLDIAVTLAGSGDTSADSHELLLLPHKTLQVQQLLELQACVDAFLEQATADRPDVSFTSHIPEDADNALSGCLVMSLTCYSRSSSSRVLDGRELQAWQDMVATATDLLSGSSTQWSSAGVHGGSGAQEDGAAPGMPRLCVVHLNSSLSTQLGISRCRTTSKLLRRCAKVLYVLAKQGYKLPECDVLLELAADGDEAQGLLGQLSQADAGTLLGKLADIMAEMQDGT